MLAHWNNRHVAPTRTYYPDSEPTSLCSFSLMPRVSGEATNTNLIVFGLTRSGLEPTIYHTGWVQRNFDDIPYRVMSGVMFYFQPIKNKPTTSWDIKNRANAVSCSLNRQYIFTVLHIIGQSKINERLPVMTPYRMLLDVTCIARKIIKQTSDFN